jgi:large subunit ribosomal protein L2
MKNIIKFFFFKVKKKFSIGLHSFGGRNFLGRVCVYHRGGGNKLKYKLIDRYRRLDQSAYVYKVFKQPSFTAFVGMVIYDNGLISFILLSHGLARGSKIFSGGSYIEKKNFSIGSSSLVKFFGLFSVINSIELFPFSGFKLVRAAGSSAYIIN